MEKTEGAVFRKDIRHWMVDHGMNLQQFCSAMNDAGYAVSYVTLRQVMSGLYPGNPDNVFRKLSLFTKIEL